MTEICLRYSAASAAGDVVDDLRRLHPVAPPAHPGEDASVVHVPALLWEQALVPEIALGLGGRLTRCRASIREPRCELAAARVNGSSGGVEP
jgi:hypothetical protein